METTASAKFDQTLNEATLSLKPFALRLTKDSEAANDLLQETVLKAFTNKEKFSTGTWKLSRSTGTASRNPVGRLPMSLYNR